MNSDGSKNSIPASDYIEVPLGGSSGQILAKNSATDHDLTWVANAGGGGGGNTYIQETEPAGATPFIWFKTNALGKVLDIRQSV